MLDLEAASVDEVGQVLKNADAAVFAAGAGPGSSAERKFTVDRDAAILLADAAEAAGVPRLIVISAINTDDFDPDIRRRLQLYLRAKSEGCLGPTSTGPSCELNERRVLAGPSGAARMRRRATSRVWTGGASRTQFELIGRRPNERARVGAPAIRHAWRHVESSAAASRSHAESRIVDGWRGR